MAWITVFMSPNIVFKPPQVTMGNDRLVKMETMYYTNFWNLKRSLVTKLILSI